MKKASFMRVLVLIAALVMGLGAACPAMAWETSRNPLLDPQPVTLVETEDEFYNILLAGIDLGNYNGYWASGGKNTLEDCHTDVIMVISLNKTKNQVSLVSLPRDTFTYVPGVHGVYKLNAAVNCADSTEEGLQRVCDAASWLLGGVPIHSYVAVDMEALISLVDAIGGVDFEMDMSYKGHSGIVYYEGMQHLDGVGVMDYVRARKNATVEHNDIGRTRRGRDMMLTIFDKIQQNMKEEGMGGLMMDLINLIFSEEFNILTNLSMTDLLSLADVALSIGGSDDIGSYVLDGGYSLALNDWNFTFTDQENRKNVLRDVYGIEAEEIPYVSWGYTPWLLEYGFPVSRQILIAREIIDYGKQQNLTEKQRQALEELENQHDVTVQAFDKAADEQTIGANDELTQARTRLRKLGEEAADALGYMRDAKWNTSTLWYRDSYVCEYTEIDWR